MANATVGIAMGAAGSDVALETADVALMAGDLAQLPFAVVLSRQTSRIMKQNLGDGWRRGEVVSVMRVDEVPDQRFWTCLRNADRAVLGEGGFVAVSYLHSAGGDGT